MPAKTKAAKRGAGRPRLDAGRARSVRATILFTPIEAEMLGAAQRSQGRRTGLPLTLAEWMRSVLLAAAAEPVQ